MDSNGRVVDYDEISEAVWLGNSTSNFSLQAISQMVSRLRNKLKTKYGILPDVIQLVQGKGYVLINN